MIPLETIIAQKNAVLALFGGDQCNVCTAIKPKIEEMLHMHFPHMHFVYIDCATHPETCAHQCVWSIPAVKVWFAGKLSGQWARAFSIEQLRQHIQRPYTLLFS